MAKKAPIERECTFLEHSEDGSQTRVVVRIGLFDSKGEQLIGPDGSPIYLPDFAGRSDWFTPHAGRNDAAATASRRLRAVVEAHKSA